MSSGVSAAGSDMADILNRIAQIYDRVKAAGVLNSDQKSAICGSI
jgi:hypothetical protein